MEPARQTWPGNLNPRGQVSKPREPGTSMILAQEQLAQLNVRRTDRDFGCK
jgi:hypothetical protein